LIGTLRQHGNAIAPGIAPTGGERQVARIGLNKATIGAAQSCQLAQCRIDGASRHTHHRRLRVEQRGNLAPSAADARSTSALADN